MYTAITHIYMYIYYVYYVIAMRVYVHALVGYLLREFVYLPRNRGSQQLVGFLVGGLAVVGEHLEGHLVPLLRATNLFVKLFP